MREPLTSSACWLWVFFLTSRLNIFIWLCSNSMNPGNLNTWYSGNNEMYINCVVLSARTTVEPSIVISSTGHHCAAAANTISRCLLSGCLCTCVVMWMSSSCWELSSPPYMQIVRVGFVKITLSFLVVQTLPVVTLLVLLWFIHSAHCLSPESIRELFPPKLWSREAEEGAGRSIEQ